MTRIFERPVIFLLTLALLSSYLFFFHSGKMGLTDPDETFYAQTAKEMLRRGEWHTPYLYDVPQFEKPILFYWLVEASFRAFGVNEFAARLPSAVFAFIGLVAIYLLGSVLFNRRVGAFSAIILATNIEYIILSRACVTDMVLTVFMLLGISFFFYGYLREKRYCYVLSSAAFALATLTKGPIAILLPLAVIAIYIIWVRDWGIFKKVPIASSVLAFVVVTLPWYLLMYRLHGKEFIDVFFGFHNVTRFLEAEHKTGSQVYYNIPILFGGFFPWSAFLPFGFWHLFKRGKGEKGTANRERKNSIFILIWFLVIFIFFSISSTKLPTYIFPCFISLALIVAVLWDDFLKGASSRSLDKGMRFSYYLLLAVTVIGSIALPIYIYFDYHIIIGGVVLSCALLLFGMFMSLVAFVTRRFLWTFLLIVYSVMLVLYPIGQLIIPQIEPYETSKVIARELSSRMKPEEGIGAESNYLAGLAFYTDKIPVDLDKHHILVNFITQEPRVWGVLKEKNHRELYELETKPYCLKASYLVYKVGKRAIITNKAPEDGKYLIRRERVK